MKSKQATVVWYKDLEDELRKHYDLGDIRSILDKVPFELMGQNTYHEYTVDGDSEFFTIDDDEIYRLWVEENNTEAVDFSHMLHRLFVDGHIEAGEYVITVWW